MNSDKPKDSIRIDLRPQTWQLTSIVVCCGLASFVACVLLTNINEETRERYRKSSMILHLACCSFFLASWELVFLQLARAVDGN